MITEMPDLTDMQCFECGEIIVDERYHLCNDSEDEEEGSYYDLDEGEEE